MAAVYLESDGELTVLGLSSQVASVQLAVSPGPGPSTYAAVVREVIRMDGDCNNATVQLLETLEQHSYKRLTELIDGNHLEEARQVAELLKAVGIV